MIKCQRCQQFTGMCEKPTRIVVETRDKIYYTTNKYGESCESGRGYETVKEIMVCRECLELYKAEEQNDVQKEG